MIIPNSLAVSDALDAMADGMTTANAGRWQVAGTARWREAIEYEGLAAAAAGAGPVMIRGGADPARHAGWQVMAGRIVAALQARASAAAGDAQEAREAAEEKDAERRVLLPPGSGVPPPHVRARLAVLAREAAKARARADACDLWAAAASEAAACGVRLSARADEVHIPVGEAIAAAGGRAWVAAGKSFSTAGS